MIYLGNKKWLVHDKVIIYDSELEFNRGDEIICYDNILNENFKDNMLTYLFNASKKVQTGILDLNGSIYGIKKNKVIRKVKTLYGEKLVSSTHVSKSSNKYCSILPINNKEASLISIIGNIGDLQSEKQQLEINYNLKFKKCKTKFNLNLDRCKNRIKLEPNEYKIYSIDSNDTYCIDDAIHLKKHEKYFEIGIHISDITSYFKFNSELDKLFQKRGSSIYLPYTVQHMMPEIIMNECSLFEGKQRRCFSLILNFDYELNLINYEFKKTNLIVNKNLTYENCLKNKNINELFNICKQLNKKYNYIKNEFNEERFIEFLMMLCNKKATEKIKEIGIYKPILRSFKLKELQLEDNLFELIKYFNSDKSLYSIENVHSEIGEYSHFTSPLRRYGDILSHFILEFSINNIQINHELNIKKIIERLNFRLLEISKGTVLSKQLMLSYELENKIIKLEKELKGIIVRISEKSILLYYNNYLISCPLINEKLNPEIELSELKIKISRNDKNVELKLGQEIEFKIRTAFQSEKFSDKLFGQIINPSLLELIY